MRRFLTITGMAIALAFVTVPAVYAQRSGIRIKKQKQKRMRKRVRKANKRANRAEKRAIRANRRVIKAKLKKPFKSRRAHRAHVTGIALKKTNRIIRRAHAKVTVTGRGQKALKNAVHQQFAARKAYYRNRYTVASHLTYRARNSAWIADRQATDKNVPPKPQKIEVMPEVGIDRPLPRETGENPEAEIIEAMKGVEAELPAVINDGVIDGLDVDIEPADSGAEPKVPKEIPKLAPKIPQPKLR